MRKLRLLATLVPLVALAFPAAAQLEKYRDWEKSPEYVYYATDDDKKAWKDVKSDAEAEKFYNLFWARRHPDYQKSPQNAFKERFDALVTKADELFALGKKRGSLTERGKVFILLGPPKSMGSKMVAPERVEGGIQTLGTVGSMTVMTQFKYEPTQLPAWTDLKTLLLTFTVDQAALTESVDRPADVKKVAKKAVAAALVNPDLKEPPVYKSREQFEAEQKAAAEAAAEAAKGPVLTAPVRGTLEALLAKEPQGPLSVFPLAYGDKAMRLMVQLGVPGSAVPAGAAAAQAAAPAPAVAATDAAPAPAAPAADAMKVALLVKGKDGKDAVRREEVAVLQKTKGDFFVDFSLPIVPGDYDVAMVLLDASGAVKVTARRPVSVPAFPAEFAMTSLLLACNDLPAQGAAVDAPFVFSARKFVTRGENRLEKTDGLAYVARVYNPAIDPATKKLNLRRAISIKPKNGPTIDVPQPADEPMLVPEGQGATTALVIDLAGAIVDVNLGDYFRPGEFTMILKITDVVAGKTIEAKAPFTLVAPPAAPPAAKAPAPKK